MNFLSPVFLYSLFALPIPFIIHLWHRHRLKKIWFPSISLIQRAERGERAFRKLKDLILLLLRTLTLLFLSLAFANPSIWVRQKTAILDDSWDMYVKSGNSTAFEMGKKEALKLKDTKILLASGTTYPSECKYQKFGLPVQDVDYIITIKDKLPDTLNPKLIEIDYDKDNFSIDSISSTSSVFLAFITNHTQEKKGRLVTLSVDSKRFESRASISPYSTTPVAFPPILEACICSVRIEETDVLMLDNTRYFVHSPLPKLKVLVVGNREEAFFIKNALSPEGGESKIQVEISPQLTSPTAYDVIVFIGTPSTLNKNTIYVPIEAPGVEGIFIDKTSHPIFAGFEFIDELKQIKFTNRQISTSPLKAIATFSDGTPAIVEHNLSGIEFMFPLNLQSKALILSPLFPPLMQRIVYWSAGKPIEEHNFVVGNTVRSKVKDFKPYKCIGGKQEISLIPKVEPTGSYVYFTAERPGIYEIDGIGNFAVNLSNSLVYPTLKIEDSKVQISLKKWLFLLVLVLLTAELIIRRI
ncbi:MAG: BatA domain-containing protein [Candidatus Stahlbacteria bacterium]|nr:BatA domain-containing protein [Candidatus Stahlbacteria bacterium]